VEATAVADGHPLFGVEGATNAIRLEVDPLGAVSSAGPALAGQGVFSDLIALAQQCAAAA
jgi:homoserine dehydrogenase